MILHMRSRCEIAGSVRLGCSPSVVTVLGASKSLVAVRLAVRVSLATEGCLSSEGLSALIWVSLATEGLSAIGLLSGTSERLSTVWVGAIGVSTERLSTVGLSAEGLSTVRRCSVSTVASNGAAVTTVASTWTLVESIAGIVGRLVSLLFLGLTHGVLVLADNAASVRGGVTFLHLGDTCQVD